MGIEKLDIFSRPYLFTVRGEREGRKTIPSAILTILILSTGQILNKIINLYIDYVT